MPHSQRGWVDGILDEATHASFDILQVELQRQVFFSECEEYMLHSPRNVSDGRAWKSSDIYVQATSLYASNQMGPAL